MTDTAAAHPAGTMHSKARALYLAGAHWADRIVHHDLLSLFARLTVAGVFWRSFLTKVETFGVIGYVELINDFEVEKTRVKLPELPLDLKPTTLAQFRGDFALGHSDLRVPRRLVGHPCSVGRAPALHRRPRSRAPFARRPRGPHDGSTLLKTPGRKPEPLRLRMVEEGRDGCVARVELCGENVFRQSLENARHICEHVGARGLIGLAMDWRKCVMTHNITELTEVAATFGRHLPTDVKFAVIHRPDQLAYAIQMTRSLSRGGRYAHAFTVPADALGWLELNAPSSESAP